MKHAVQLAPSTPASRLMCKSRFKASHNLIELYQRRNCALYAAFVLFKAGARNEFFITFFVPPQIYYIIK